jgi:hypothetical protein
MVRPPIPHRRPRFLLLLLLVILFCLFGFSFRLIQLCLRPIAQAKRSIGLYWIEMDGASPCGSVSFRRLVADTSTSYSVHSPLSPQLPNPYLKLRDLARITPRRERPFQTAVPPPLSLRRLRALLLEHHPQQPLDQPGSASAAADRDVRHNPHVAFPHDLHQLHHRVALRA